MEPREFVSETLNAFFLEGCVFNLELDRQDGVPELHYAICTFWSENTIVIKTLRPEIPQRTGIVIKSDEIVATSIGPFSTSFEYRGNNYRIPNTGPAQSTAQKLAILGIDNEH